MKMEEIPSLFSTQEKVAVPRLPLPNRCGCQDFGRLLQRQNGRAETTSVDPTRGAQKEVGRP